jgi:predicted TIM-barrel fold metal-dependent hydrolase
MMADAGHIVRRDVSRRAAIPPKRRGREIPKEGREMETVVGYRTIDADGHVLEPLDLWAEYTDPAFREKAPRMLFTERGGEVFWVSDDFSLGDGIKTLGTGGTFAASDTSPELQMFRLDASSPKWVDGVAGGFDPRKRLVDMDRDGIDVTFLYPTLGLFLDMVHDSAQAAANYRAYNRWLADYCSAAPDRLYGVAALPLQSVETAIAELRHCVKTLGFKAAFVRPNPYNGRPLHHPDFHPLWQEAQELDCAIAVHGGAAQPNLGSDRFPVQEGMAVEHCVVHTFEMMAASASFIMCGICERFPRLRVAFLEASGGWMLGWIDRMDRHYIDRVMNDTILTVRPSEIYRRQCFVSFEPTERSIKLIADVLGSDTMLWSSDYPHPDGFWNAVGMIRKMELGPTLERDLLANGAARFYGLDA